MEETAEPVSPAIVSGVEETGEEDVVEEGRSRKETREEEVAEDTSLSTMALLKSLPAAFQMPFRKVQRESTRSGSSAEAEDVRTEEAVSLSGKKFSYYSVARLFCLRFTLSFAVFPVYFSRRRRRNRRVGESGSD